MQETLNFIPRLPADILVQLRFSKSDLLRLGKCSREVLNKIDILWKAIFSEENAGYCPDNVSSWRLFYGSNFVQKNNMNHRRILNLEAKFSINVSFVLIDSNMYVVHGGKLICADDLTNQNPHEIPLQQTHDVQVRRYNSELFSTLSPTDKTFTLWRKRSALITLTGEGFEVKNNLLVCVQESDVSDFSIWDLNDRNLSKSVLRLPKGSMHIGRVADLIFSYVKGQGVFAHRMDHSTLPVMFSLPAEFSENVDTPPVFQLSEQALVLESQETHFWYRKFTDSVWGSLPYNTLKTKPVLQENFIFCAANSGNVCCFDLSEKKLTKRYIPEGVSKLKDLIVSGNRVCILRNQDATVFDRDSQQMLFTINESHPAATVQVHSGILHLVLPRKIAFFDMANGKELTSVDSGVSGDGFVYSESSNTLINFMKKRTQVTAVEAAANYMTSVVKDAWSMVKCFGSIGNDLAVANAIEHEHDHDYHYYAAPSFSSGSHHSNDDDDDDDSD